MKILFLNILEGCPEPERLQKIIAFVRKQNPDILGLSELNHWDQNNFQKLKSFQKEVGLDYTAFCKSKNGYHVGLFSKYPIENTITDNENFRNGAVFARVQGMKVIVAHLTPKTENERLLEVDVVDANVADGEKAVLMGDMNSLSPQDEYSNELLIELNKRGVTKFGVTHLSNDVISKIKEIGFDDVVRVYSEEQLYSVPTPATPEGELYTHFAKLRLDYIFTKNLKSSVRTASIIHTAETDVLSDHYPVTLELNTTEDVVEIYNTIANQYSETFDSDYSDEKYLEPFVSRIPSGGSVIDFGCGTGRLTDYFNKKGYRTIGVDLSEKMLEIARSKYPHIEFMRGDMRNFVSNKAPFDGVSFSYSFFHLEKAEALKTLQHANTLLKSGGSLLAILQEGAGEVFVDEPFAPGKKLFVSLYHEDEFTSLLGQAGFTVCAMDRKRPELKGELLYDKLFFVAKKN